MSPPHTDLRWRASWCGAALLFSACRPPQNESPAPPGSQLAEVEPDAADCPHDDPFDELQWLPATSQTLARIDIHATSDGVALSHLGTWMRAAEPRVAVDVAFALAQLEWQVPLLVQLLADVGLNPAELVYARTHAKQSTWILRTQCDADRLRDRWSERHGLVFRATALGPVGTTDGPFPHDIWLWGADRLVLTPKGEVSAIQAAFAEPSDGKTTRLSTVLAQVATAPIQLVARHGRGLEPWAASAAAPLEAVFLARVDAVGLTIEDVAPALERASR